MTVLEGTLEGKQEQGRSQSWWMALAEENIKANEQEWRRNS